jgi:hypothetical protein
MRADHFRLYRRRARVQRRAGRAKKGEKVLRSPAAPSFSAVFDGRDQIISTCPAVRSLEQDLMRSRRAANQLDRCGGVIRYDL